MFSYGRKGPGLAGPWARYTCLPTCTGTGREHICASDQLCAAALGCDALSELKSGCLPHSRSGGVLSYSVWLPATVATVTNVRKGLTGRKGWRGAPRAEGRLETAPEGLSKKASTADMAQRSCQDQWMVKSMEVCSQVFRLYHSSSLRQEYDQHSL